MSTERCKTCGNWAFGILGAHRCPPAWQTYLHGEPDTERTVYAHDADDAAREFASRRCSDDCENFRDDGSMDVVVSRDGRDPVVYRISMSLTWSFGVVNHRGSPLETFDPEDVW